MARKTQDELLAADWHSLRFPHHVWAVPGGGFQHSSWYGGVRYVRDDIHAAALAEAQATIARLEALIAQESEFLAVVQAKKDAYMMALASIRDNTCCEGCQESARVARAALMPREGEG